MIKVYKCEKCKQTYNTEKECKECEALCQEMITSLTECMKTFRKWRALHNKTPKEYSDLDDFIRKNPVSNDGLRCEINTKCLNVNNLPRFSFNDKCCCDDRYEGKNDK